MPPVGYRVDLPDVASSPVRVQDVTVRYPGRAEPALQGASLDLDIWRRQVAYLSQHPRLFAGTIADNVRLGAHLASDDEVRRALHAAGAGFVEGLPTGIDTLLGERGSGLSAGQRQRIALARTFLSDTPLVILDEPTSGLDVDSEATVLDAMRQFVAGRTVLLVTHRPALLTIVDRVVRLDRVAVAA